MQSFQYGEQSSASPVEPASDVGDDLGVGVKFAHLGDLPVEVAALFG